VGRTIGYPTINIRVENGILMPHRGVYVSRVTVDGQSFKAVTNVGTRPTFTDADIVSVESHLLDFSGDIYGHEAQVEFLKFLRPERSFKDGDALRMQIAKDIRQALEYRG
jgi:riboflavin kinase/FMN adenylyltransferase